MPSSLAASLEAPVVRCAWCDEPADRRPPADAVSHGICPDCLRRVTARGLRLAEPVREDSPAARDARR